MKTKSVLYAVVGAPVVAVRKVGDKAGGIRVKLSENATGYGQAAEKAIDNWAVEGEKVVGRITDGKVVEEISSKVDLDQAKEQVGKLRDQLEDMLATWRTSFRPEKSAEKPTETAKAPAKKPAAKTTAKTGTTTKASPAKTTRSSAEKTSSSKTTSASAEKAS